MAGRRVVRSDGASLRASFTLAWPWVILFIAALYATSRLFDAVSWRPDGRALAVWDGGVSVTGALPQLPIYDARTGRKLLLLPVPPAASSSLDIGLNAPYDLLRWSPDGKRLALMSGELSSLIIWTLK